MVDFNNKMMMTETHQIEMKFEKLRCGLRYCYVILQRM